MRFIILTSQVFLASKHVSAWVLTQNVALPLTSKYSGAINESIRSSFNTMVEEISYLEHMIPEDDDEDETLTCTVPLMGKAKISLKPNVIDKFIPSSILDYTLTVEADNEEDLGFLCNKLLHLLDQEHISLYPLKEKVANYLNSLPPDPGHLAYDKKNDKCLSKIMGGGELRELKETGFVVLDSNLITTSFATQSLSRLLKEKTGQNKSIRSDTVTFLTEHSATDCGLLDQFQLLMGIASYLNEHLEFEESEFEPLSPGTARRPLTVPLEIQAAEYREGEFYIEHSDNSLASDVKRSNYRCYTCILYVNDSWNYHRDGGALRIYSDSLNIKPQDAPTQCEYTDVNPSNGKLLIFDSRLVHSVEEVISKDKGRLALTLWILRPEKSAVRGEIYDAGERR